MLSTIPVILMALIQVWFYFGNRKYAAKVQLI